MTALQADNSIIISQGASENLPLLLDRLWRAPGTNIVTITLGAEPSEWEVWLMEQLPADFR
ncbi:MAG: hypothetical protein R2822_26965 [Spirosomataceae bacterium]